VQRLCIVVLCAVRKVSRLALTPARSPLKKGRGATSVYCDVLRWQAGPVCYKPADCVRALPDFQTVNLYCDVFRWQAGPVCYKPADCVGALPDFQTVNLYCDVLRWQTGPVCYKPAVAC
jgi:hypothetical protein